MRPQAFLISVGYTLATLACDEANSTHTDAAASATPASSTSASVDKLKLRASFVKLAEGDLVVVPSPEPTPEQMLEALKARDRDAAPLAPSPSAHVGSPPIAIGGFDEVMIYWSADAVLCPQGGEAWFRPDATSEFGFTGQKILGGRIKSDGVELKVVLSPGCKRAHFVVAAVKPGAAN